MVRRALAVIVGLTVIGAVAAPSVTPARGQSTMSIAVQQFQNEAGAPAGVASTMSQALYRAVASSHEYTGAGNGPLPLGENLTADPFVDALSAAAKAGADELLLGSIVGASGGQVYYRLSLYRVAPVAFIGSQVFSQTYPPGDATALTASLAGNVATLAAPRQAVGTIYSTADGVKTDTGSSDGFVLGDRFNVMRGGQRMAEAQITDLRNDDATISIANAASGYTPAVGDTVVGLRPLAPTEPAPGTASSFSILGILAAAGGVLLAIGHHGQPAAPGLIGGSPTPSGSASPFSVTEQNYIDQPPNITFTFIFSALLGSASQTGIPGNTTYAYVTTQQPGSQATSPPAPLDSIGQPPTFTTITGSNNQQESQMTVNAQNLVSGETITFTFNPAITDISGNPLQPIQWVNTVSRTHHVLPSPVKHAGSNSTTPGGSGSAPPPHPLPKPPPKAPPR